MRGPRREGRGFTYIEVVAAIALLGIALLGSTGLLLRWHATSSRLENRAVAEHALAQEMDQVLASEPDLKVGTWTWLSGADESSGLEGADGELRVERLQDSKLRRVLLTLRWEGGEASRETLL